MWEAMHHMIRVLGQGESAAADTTAKLGSNAESARELAYRLYRMCEQKGCAQEAQGYNELVQSWPGTSRLTRGAASTSDLTSGRMRMHDNH